VWIALVACSGKPAPTAHVAPPPADAAVAVVAPPADAAPDIPFDDSTLRPVSAADLDVEVDDSALPTAIADLEEHLKHTKDPLDAATWHALLGVDLWRQSCPSADHGLCVKSAAVAHHCGAADLALTTAAKRKKTDDALAHVKAALTLWDDGAVLDPQRSDADAQLVRAIAHAELVRADQSFEALLAITPPHGLDFGKKKQASMKKFSDWFQALSKQAQVAEKQYEALFSDKNLQQDGVVSLIEAAARIGQLDEWVADQIEGLELPSDVAGDADATTAYCQQVSTQADPLRAKAVEAYQACENQAANLGVTSLWSELCHDRRTALSP